VFQLFSESVSKGVWKEMAGIVVAACDDDDDGAARGGGVRTGTSHTDQTFASKASLEVREACSGQGKKYTHLFICSPVRPLPVIILSVFCSFVNFEC
jgi:hypothetical protein